MNKTISINQNTICTCLSALLLAAVLIIGLPLIICMPLTADPVLYDLQAKAVLEGGLLYRDVVEPNLPGIVWLHLLIRSLLGWSDYALRSVDLLIISSCVLLLVRWPGTLFQAFSCRQRVNSLLLMAVLFWFYFGLCEWCHCQRDPWLLLPALLALGLRWRQIQRLEQSRVPQNERIFGYGFLEGCLWAAGFWIKPFIAFPALAVIVLGVWWNRACWKRSLIDGGGVLCGGLMIGAVGTGWLVQSGTWPHFYEMLTEWNPTYFQIGQERWTWERLWGQQLRFLPFSLAHLFAIPCAFWLVIRSLKLRNRAESTRSQALLAAVYLAWLFQSFRFQHIFDYIHVPELMLALTITIRQLPRLCRIYYRRYQQLPNKNWQLQERATGQALIVITGCLLILAVLQNPAFKWSRLQYWPNCLTQGSTPEVRTALQHVPLPDWNELQPVLDYLSQQNLQDHELTVQNVHLVHVYPALQLRPSSRYVYLDLCSRVFKQRHPEIVSALDQSGHRYILSSLLENGLSWEDCQQVDVAQPHQLPTAFPEDQLTEFPYHHELVFRSGQYVIHRVSGTVAPLNGDFSPLAQRE